MHMTYIAKGLATAALLSAGWLGWAAPAQAAGDAVNLPVTDAVRAELVQSGATLTGRPVSEFRGLTPGRTYYAFEPSSGMHWAAAQLQANSYDAGIMLQDQNSYMFFHQAAAPGSTWIPIAAGFGPIPAGEESCPMPESVRQVWQWPAGKCYPPPQ
jgi:hypothetical protein